MGGHGASGQPTHQGSAMLKSAAVNSVQVQELELLGDVVQAPFGAGMGFGASGFLGLPEGSVHACFLLVSHIFKWGPEAALCGHLTSGRTHQGRIGREDCTMDTGWGAVGPPGEPGPPAGSQCRQEGAAATVEVGAPRMGTWTQRKCPTRPSESAGVFPGHAGVPHNVSR